MIVAGGIGAESCRTISHRKLDKRTKFETTAQGQDINTKQPFALSMSEVGPTVMVHPMQVSKPTEICADLEKKQVIKEILQRNTSLRNTHSPPIINANSDTSESSSRTTPP
ncbi:hypothetical protein H112_01041 [Trichophyton rubrum D6]|nr:hypothetical protein H113_01042 [Trichophyton rubrum MR1459]EZG10345.1 hypothetical protein H106_00837 [Trichophyton rubrum CBS 735.88]KDB37636.1 hypothetical protein H112_01041 [Trichophyton rubrum D6]